MKNPLDLLCSKVMSVFDTIIKQVALNKSNLLLKIQMKKTLTLQLYPDIIKMESIYKSN
jgi:hypothetical protein